MYKIYKEKFSTINTSDEFDNFINKFSNGQAIYINKDGKDVIEDQQFNPIYTDAQLFSATKMELMNKAILTGNLDLIKYIENKYGATNVYICLNNIPKFYDNTTQINKAISLDYLPIVKYFIDQFDMNIHFNCVSLELALYTKNEELITYLISKGARPNSYMISDMNDGSKLMPYSKTIAKYINENNLYSDKSTSNSTNN